MDLTLQYNDGGVENALDVAILSLADLTPIFERFMAWLRPEINKVFEQQGPGWAPLAKATQSERKRTLPARAESIRSKALYKLERSVKRTLGRAQDRLAKTGGTSKLLERRRRTVAKQERQTAEIARVIREGGTTQSGREFKTLGARVEKYRGRAEDKIAALERGELLGRIARSIRAKIENKVLTIESAIDWAGIHNDGGVAGKGARIPERKFLEWTPERIAKFVEIAQQYVIEKLDKARAKASPNEWVERAT